MPKSLKRMMDELTPDLRAKLVRRLEELRDAEIDPELIEELDRIADQEKIEAMIWKTIDTIPDDDRPKLIAFANGSVTIAPGIAPLDHDQEKTLRARGLPEPDPQWTPTFWMYVPKAPMQ